MVAPPQPRLAVGFMTRRLPLNHTSTSASRQGNRCPGLARAWFWCIIIFREEGEVIERRSEPLNAGPAGASALPPL